MEAQDAPIGTGLDNPAAQARPVRKTLWTVQEGNGQAPTFIFVLAGYGDAWVARGLARALGPDHSVYGVQPPDENVKRPASELAVMYVEQVRSVQPHGPYYLGGYSAGAVMALEMAVQFRRQNEAVGLVALLDPLFIRYTRLEYLSYIFFQKVCRLIEKMLRRKPRVLQILDAMFEDEGLDRHLEALAGHKPGRYAGDIVFYQARWSIGRSPLLVRQWKWFTGARLKLETVPGDHHTFIRPPHVAGLTERMSSALREAAASRSQ